MKHSLPVIGTVLLATSGLALAQSDPVLQRLSSEFQNTASGVDEVATSAAAVNGGLGGTPEYTKSLTIPTDVNVIYITFSAQGDSHNGSTLAMTATVNGTLIQPVLGETGTGGGNCPSGWWCLNKLPRPVASLNCNDGGGGTGDCHDNTIYFSGCARVTPGSRVTVVIKLGDVPGGDVNFAFYERSSINIDGTGDLVGAQCRGVGTGPHD